MQYTQCRQYYGIKLLNVLTTKGKQRTTFIKKRFWKVKVAIVCVAFKPVIMYSMCAQTRRLKDTMNQKISDTVQCPCIT